MPTLGLLMLQTRFPRPWGDVGHPQTFAFPVLRKEVQSATPERIVRGSDEAMLQPFIDAAQELAAEGCAAIATSCGFLARWQRELQAALPVPMWSSALLQLAEQQRLGRRCGVITPGSALHCTLLQDLPELDQADAQAQVLAAAARLRARHPDIDTLVLECTNPPPYAPALRQATGLPVLDVVTLLTQRMAALARPG
jgi:Asp/Glu/hydantoin racemase